MFESIVRISYTLVIIVFALLFMSMHGGAQGRPKDAVRDDIRAVPIYDFAGIEPIFSSESDTTFVINFWATWCAPCIEELPYFEELTQSVQGRSLKVILVNLDFRKQLTKRLLPFLKERDIRSTVLVLDDPDANSWISRVDESWTGAIPATIVFRGQRREFREQSFTREELFQLVHSFTE